MTSTPNLTLPAWAAEPLRATYSLSLCGDCALLVSNGETGQGEAYDAGLAAAQVLRHGDDAARIVMAWAEHENFSAVPCGGCGTVLAGSRFPAVIL